MVYEPRSPEEYDTCTSYLNFIAHYAHVNYGYHVCTIAGVRRNPAIPFTVTPGGVGLLEYRFDDQKDTYWPHGMRRGTFRHSCNIWFSNDSIHATPSNLIIEVFHQSSEQKLEELREFLTAAGLPKVSLLPRREESPRMEKTLADYGIPVRE